MVIWVCPNCDEKVEDKRYQRFVDSERLCPYCKETSIHNFKRYEDGVEKKEVIDPWAFVH